MSVTQGQSMENFPFVDAQGRIYHWTGKDGAIYGTGKITRIAICDDHNNPFIAFYTDNRHGEYTFGFSADWVSWHLDGDNIVLVPRATGAGKYVLYAPDSTRS